MFLNGGLQFGHSTTPRCTFLKDSPCAEVTDFILETTPWHSLTPIAKDLFLRCPGLLGCWFQTSESTANFVYFVVYPTFAYQYKTNLRVIRKLHGPPLFLCVLSPCSRHRMSCYNPAPLQQKFLWSSNFFVPAARAAYPHPAAAQIRRSNDVRRSNALWS